MHFFVFKPEHFLTVCRFSELKPITLALSSSCLPGRSWAKRCWWRVQLSPSLLWRVLKHSRWDSPAVHRPLLYRHLGFQDLSHPGWTRSSGSLCSGCRSLLAWEEAGGPSDLMHDLKHSPSWRNLEEENIIYNRSINWRLNYTILEGIGSNTTYGNCYSKKRYGNI